MPKATPIPEPVKRAARAACATRKKGAAGTRDMLVEKFEMSARQAQTFLTREKLKIDDLRGAISEKAFEAGGQMLVEIQKDLVDSKKMKLTPVRDKALAFEKIINAATTAADGHQPLVQVNFPDGRALKEMLAKHDEHMRMKKLSGRVVS